VFACRWPVTQSFAVLRRYPSSLRLVCLHALGLLSLALPGFAENADLGRLKPGNPVDYASLAFQPDIWYPALQRDPLAIPHYVFYEMGRNFYTFGDRHSCFVTGFAVFMRYVCMDTLKFHDEDRRTRQTIEEASCFSWGTNRRFEDDAPRPGPR
jgi:hypothetical protein